MIRFTATLVDDLPEIQRWIDADADHAGKMEAPWWRGGDVLNCCAEDEHGPVMYLRIDKEKDKVRMHIQFAPTNEVSKLRVAGAFIEGLPRMILSMKKLGFSAIVYESTSQSLIRFMWRMHFVPLGENQYLRPFTI